MIRRLKGNSPPTLSPLDAPAEIGREIHLALPTLRPRLEALFPPLHEFIAFVHGIAKEPVGISTIVNQAVNDLTDLVLDTSTGRGRPALRSTRSLFELLVTLRDVLAMPELGQRYEDFRFVVEVLQAELQVDDRTVVTSGGHEKTASRNDLRAKVDELVSLYGASFRRQWINQSLRDRAARHSLEEEYDFYKLASAVLHGAAGGELGQRRTIGGQVVHRQGPALFLCEISLRKGLQYFVHIVNECGPGIGGPSLSSLQNALKACIDLLPDYERALAKVDNDLWPQSAPATVDPVLVVYDSGERTAWFIHDPQRVAACRALPPRELPPETRIGLESLLKFLRERAEPFNALSIAVPGLQVEVRPGTRWIHCGNQVPIARHFTVNQGPIIYQHQPLRFEPYEDD